MLSLLLPFALLSVPQHACCGTMAMFASDPAFLAMHPSPRALRFQATTGHMVRYRDSTGAPTLGFYVPPKRGARAAVIMVHEFWGLNDFMKREAEKLNKREGYAVLAVDLYNGKVASDAQTASQYMQETKD